MSSDWVLSVSSSSPSGLWLRSGLHLRSRTWGRRLINYSSVLVLSRIMVCCSLWFILLFIFCWATYWFAVFMIYWYICFLLFIDLNILRNPNIKFLDFLSFIIKSCHSTFFFVNLSKPPLISPSVTAYCFSFLILVSNMGILSLVTFYVKRRLEFSCCKVIFLVWKILYK